MKWTLAYKPDARDRLARLLDGADPAVILAVARLHAVLENCPRSAGESRETGERIAFDGPLVLDYELDETEREVRVTDVRRTDRWPDDDPDGPDDVA